MKFAITQRFAADRTAVLCALSDRSYLSAMGELPDLSAPIVESQERTGDVVRQRLRYTFAGTLPGAVTAVIDPGRLSWHELTMIDTAAARAEFTMVPIHYQKFFTCKGSWTLIERSADGRTCTDRVIEGDLKVNSPVPFVGSKVEKAILSGLRERLAMEPDVFERWLATR